jgi:hypothetical protein
MPIVRRCLLCASLLAAAVAAIAPDAGAQGGPPCPPGSPVPTVTTEDQEAGAGGTLTATHTIDLEADFPSGASPDSVQVSAPPGVAVRAQGSTGASIVSDAPGVLPLTLSWTQLESDGTECTASTSVTLQLQAPAPLAFGKLPRGLRPKFAKFSGGWAWVAMVGQYTDRRPVELRFRAIARARLPSPAMPFKVVTVPLRSLEPGLFKQRYLRGPKWQVTAHITYTKPTAFILESGVKTGSVHDHPLGYELQVLQGGRLLIRVREAGKCNFGGCKFRTVKVERGT